ncbi:MAG: hypothetical protein ACPL7J_00450, partial [Desulfomonilaceae bacterium]
HRQNFPTACILLTRCVQFIVTLKGFGWIMKTAVVAHPVTSGTEANCVSTATIRSRILDWRVGMIGFPRI